jgi:hypothetical protein
MELGGGGVGVSWVRWFSDGMAKAGDARGCRSKVDWMWWLRLGILF